MFLEIIDVRVYAPLLLFTLSNLESQKVKQLSVNKFKRLQNIKVVIRTVSSVSAISFPMTDAFSVTIFSSSFKLECNFI